MGHNMEDNPFENDQLTKDPFAEDPFANDQLNKIDKIDEINDLNKSVKQNIIIQSEQRNAKKFTTSVINFPDILSSKEFISEVKKKCQCNGSIKNNRKKSRKNRKY